MAFYCFYKIKLKTLIRYFPLAIFVFLYQQNLFWYHQDPYIQTRAKLYPQKPNACTRERGLSRNQWYMFQNMSCVSKVRLNVYLESKLNIWYIKNNCLVLRAKVEMENLTLSLNTDKISSTHMYLVPQHIRNHNQISNTYLVPGG